MRQFPFPNQVHARRSNTERYPNLRPLPTSIGKISLEGTRAAIRTVIRYRNGVLGGKGASLLDGYMEDLATDRIYRLMIAQRMRHRNEIKVVDKNGAAVEHTPRFISQLFDKELDQILGELPTDVEPAVAENYREARRLSEEMIMAGQFDPI